MTITYTMDNVLYLNITNKCCNSCDFCIRNYSDTVGDATSLWLEREPSVDEVIEDIKKRDLATFKEVVFCGYGEPCERIAELIEIAKFIKSISNISIRINTNGQGNLMHKKDITPLFKDVIDVISISLNAKNPADYQKICHSTFGEES
ncbi:MAG: TatD family nuclease-associated radical SAM protein, partial [Clostridia bacterium]